MIEIRVKLEDGAVITDIASGPLTGEEIAAEFETVRRWYSEPVEMELKYIATRVRRVR